MEEIWYISSRSCQEEHVRRDVDAELFSALQCHLGMMGLVTRLTLRVVPFFHLNGSMEPVLAATVLFEAERLARTAASADHVRLHWFPHTGKLALWRANRVINHAEDSCDTCGQ